MDAYEDVLRVAAAQVFPGLKAVVDHGHHLVILNSDDQTQYECWCSEPERRSRGLPFAERVADTVAFLKIMLNDQHSTEISWERLMPIVRDVGFVLAPQIYQGVVWRSLSPHLVEIIGLDHPESTEVVSVDTLETWGVAERKAELWTAARTNMEREGLRYQIAPIGATGQGAAFVITPWGYQTSWLSMPEYFDKPIGAMANPVYGFSRPLVFPVSRNEMFVLPEADELAIDAALTYAAEVYTDDRRAMLPCALTVEDGVFVPWRKQGNPLAERSWGYWRQYLRDGYVHQAELYEASGADQLRDQDRTLVPVAGRGNEPTTAMLALDEEIPTPLLPRVEYLDVLSIKGRLLIPWEKAVGPMGLHPAEGYWPERWLVGARPDALEDGHCPVWLSEPTVWQALRDIAVSRSVLEV